MWAHAERINAKIRAPHGITTKSDRVFTRPGPGADIRPVEKARQRIVLFAAFNAGLKKLQEVPPRIDAGLGVGLRRAAHAEQTIGHALNLQPERARGSRSARHA